MKGLSVSGGRVDMRERKGETEESKVPLLQDFGLSDRMETS